MGSGTYDKAAKTAKKAAQAASDYTQLSSDMGFVSGLPLTSNTQADVAKAERAFARIVSTCKALGVPGIQRA